MHFSTNWYRHFVKSKCYYVTLWTPSCYTDFGTFVTLVCCISYGLANCMVMPTVSHCENIQVSSNTDSHIESEVNFRLPAFQTSMNLVDFESFLLEFGIFEAACAWNMNQCIYKFESFFPFIKRRPGFFWRFLRESKISVFTALRAE